MNTYRIYMSVRIAATGEQVADITILRGHTDPKYAECVVEEF